MLVDSFPWKINFSAIFDFRLRDNPRFREEFQALHKRFSPIQFKPQVQGCKQTDIPKPDHLFSFLVQDKVLCGLNETESVLNNITPDCFTDFLSLSNNILTANQGQLTCNKKSKHARKYPNNVSMLGTAQSQNALRQDPGTCWATCTSADMQCFPLLLHHRY